MVSLGNPRTCIPYMNGKDCSQGICSFYCPQWCYTTYPPPPPPPFEYHNAHDSSPNFPPLIIAIIGILAIVFLLVSYYTIMSKYYYPRENYHDHQNDEELQYNHHIHNSSLMLQHVSSSSTTTGLDEALIKSIMICKYKKGDHGFVEFSDCSVCLNEFQDGESVRLLPKCGHAFHLPCIDTWLKSHTTCPLCRANIFTFNSSTSQLRGTSQVDLELIPSNETLSENQHAAENIIVGSETEFGVMKEESTHGTSDASKPTLRSFSDLGSLQEEHKIVEIRDEVFKSIRSVSLDHLVADVLHMNNQEQDSQSEGCTSEAGPSKRDSRSKSSYKRRMLHCVLSPIAMKISSFPRGRFSLSKSERGRQRFIHV